MAATLYAAGDPDAPDPIDRCPRGRTRSFPATRWSASIPIRTSARGCICWRPRRRSEFLRRFSAEQNVSADTPPAFIWHTAEDDCVPVQNSLLLAGALAAKGVPFELHVFPEGPHGLGLAPENPDVARWAPMCQRWLIAQGFGKRS